MAKIEKTMTPPVISHVSLVNFLNQLRENGVPTRIDKSLMPKASGSQSAGILAALRYLGLIDEVGKPVEQFKSIVLAADEDRKDLMVPILQKSYSFIFDDPEFDLKNATSGEMTEKFRGLEISGSTLTKTISFFLAAAKDYGIPVSGHIKAPAAPKSTGSGRKVSKGRDEGKKSTKPENGNDGDEQDLDEEVERFEIPIPGKKSFTVTVPKDLDADDWEMLQSMISVYIKRWKGFAAP